MRINALLPITLATASIVVSVVDAQRPNRRDSKLQHVTFEIDGFDSKALKQRVRYGVFLPKDYDKDKNKTYPMVLYLHGMWEDHQRFRSRGGAPVLDRLVGSKVLPPCIFVCANGGRSSFYINGKKSGRYEDMVSRELLAHVQKSYRIAKGRENRALMGVSMGGWGALKMAFKRPKDFGVVATHSAALLTRDPKDLTKQFPWLRGRGSNLLTSIFGKPTDLKMWKSENPLHLADHLDPKKLEGLKIYFDCGTADRYGFHSPNQELHRVLDKRKVKHVWRSVKGGGHGWRSGYNQRQIEHSLTFIAQAWATKRATRALGGMLGRTLGGGDEDGSKKSGKKGGDGKK